MTKEINLLVDAHVFDGMFQGTRTFLKGIYSNLDTEKYSIKVFLAANEISNLKKEFEGVNNIEFVKLKYKNKFLRLGYEIPKIIRELNIDFAHFNYYLPLFLNKKCRYIVTIHDILFLDYPQYFPKTYYYKNKFLFKWAAKRAEILNTVSDYSAERLKVNFNIWNKEISVLPNAIGEDFYTPRDKVSDREYIKDKFGASNFIIYVSRLEPRKNHIALIEAYRSLKLWEKDIELVFVGKNAIENKELAGKIEEIKIQSKHKFYHFENINFKDLKAFYNAAIVSVFPSYCEGFGIPPLESAALQTPTICSNSTAMEEFKFFEKNHIDPSQEHLEQALNNMLLQIKENSLHQELVEISNTIQSKYQWNIGAERLSASIIAAL